MSQFFHTNPAAMPPSGPKGGPWRRDLPRTWRAALDLPEPLLETRIPAGTYTLGPGQGTLSLRTTRTGAAAKAGHDLLIHVTSWEATLDVGEDPAATRIALDADGASLRVREGTGGMQALGDDDRANIEKTIDDEILKRGADHVPLDRGRAGARRPAARAGRPRARRRGPARSRSPSARPATGRSSARPWSPRAAGG